VRRSVRYLALIPARGGSKGLPGKNMRLLGAKPLLQYTLEAARRSARLDKALFSGDDEAMIALAVRLGIPAPFVRPASLAADASPMLDVALHALDWLEEHESVQAENLVLLQPTCPFRDSGDIDAAVAAFEAAGRETLCSVEPVMQHPCECVMLAGDKLRWAVVPEGVGEGRQAFPEYYFINGAIYSTRVACLRERGKFADENSAIHIMAPSHGLDINTQYEFDLARGLVAFSSQAEA
jgi:CMP-N,N'-diacetyllegionaminic acid synthase